MAALKISIITFGIFLSCHTSLSHASNTQETAFLPNYTATYSTLWKKGISLKVKGTQTLKKKSESLWEFTYSAKNFFASLYESSSVKVAEGQIVPQEYEYKSSVFGKKKTALLTFNWDKNIVRNDIKNRPWNLSIQPDTLDKLSVQLQIRQDLKNQKDILDYQIADGGRIKNWTFEQQGIEKVSTKIGDISAIKVMRTDNLHKGKQTFFWFAPKYDYLLVKLEHKEDKELYELNIESLK